MTEELNPNTQDDTIESVVAFAQSLPDFPNKTVVLQRLQTGNLNRYQEALMLINEQIARLESGENSDGATADQLQALVSKIAKQEAQDPIAE